jgi:hypothetical protein
MKGEIKMKRQLFTSIILLCIVIAGCGPAAEKKEIVVKINDYQISKDRFEAEFKDSIYGQNDTPDARKKFLNSLIDRKLILQDAQARGLDKEQGFLRAIERFWEQSLLKMALDNKTKEISGSISVNDAQVRQRYDFMVQEGTISQPYEQASEQLKREIIKLKESEAMNDWIAQLNKKAQIKINYELLKQK